MYSVFQTIRLLRMRRLVRSVRMISCQVIINIHSLKLTITIICDNIAMLALIIQFKNRSHMDRFDYTYSTSLLILYHLEQMYRRTFGLNGPEDDKLMLRTKELSN